MYNSVPDLENLFRIRSTQKCLDPTGGRSGSRRTKYPQKSSVADPKCLSRILIFTHPGSRISDPKTATKERGEKKISCHTFL
jgi:hypothetical protein